MKWRWYQKSGLIEKIKYKKKTHVIYSSDSSLASVSFKITLEIQYFFSPIICNLTLYI